MRDVRLGRPPYAVALISSRGGLAATLQVLGGLPSRFAGALVVLQHSEPTGPSRLATALSPHTALNVRDGHDGAPLCGGTAWVAPPGFHTLVTPAGRLSLIPSGPFPPYRPSADLLLVTLAISFGSAAIAVIMTGSGTDGATGASAVHHHGGLVLATDEVSSTDFSMPRAAIERDHAVDTVLPLDQVAARLGDLIGSAG